MSCARRTGFMVGQRGNGATGQTLQYALYGLRSEFIDLAKLLAKLRARSNESAYALLKGLGVTEKAALLAIKHIPDLMGELGDCLPFLRRQNFEMPFYVGAVATRKEKITHLIEALTACPQRASLFWSLWLSLGLPAAGLNAVRSKCSNGSSTPRYRQLLWLSRLSPWS